MLKKAIQLFLLILLFINILYLNLYSGILKIQPEKPMLHQEVNFQYFPDQDFNNNHCIAILYFFKNDSIEPEAFELILNKQENFYTNKLLIKDDLAYALIKIKIGEDYDSNFQEFWDFIVQINFNFPMKDAFYFKSYSYLGSLPENCQRLSNFKKAIEYLEEELKYHPTNTKANLSLLLLKYERKMISEKEFKNSIKKIYEKESEKLDESSTILLIRALKLIKEDNKADIVENSFISMNPFSKLAQEKELRKMSTLKSFQEFNEKAFNFLKTYPNSHLAEKIWIAIIHSFLQNNKLKEIVDKIIHSENIPYTTYSRLAFNILKNRDLFPENEIKDIINQLIDKALIKLKESIEYQKPQYFSQEEWKKVTDANLSKFYQDWGDILSLMEKPEEALEKYLAAIEFLQTDLPVSLSESAILLASQLGRDTLALDLAAQAIFDSKSTNFIDSVFKNIYLKTNHDNADSFIDSLRTKAVIKRREKIRQNMLQTQLDIFLQGPDKSIINLSTYKGNILILVLWGKWCSPCVDLLRLFELFDQKTLIKQNLILFPVNTLDTDEKSNSEFLKQNNLAINYYLDPNYEIALNAGLTGLPVTIFIDKSGKIRHIEKGYLDKKSYEQIFNDIIEILNN